MIRLKHPAVRCGLLLHCSIPEAQPLSFVAAREYGTGHAGYRCLLETANVKLSLIRSGCIDLIFDRKCIFRDLRLFLLLGEEVHECRKKPCDRS